MATVEKEGILSMENQLVSEQYHQAVEWLRKLAAPLGKKAYELEKTRLSRWGTKRRARRIKLANTLTRVADHLQRANSVIKVRHVNFAQDPSGRFTLAAIPVSEKKVAETLIEHTTLVNSKVRLQVPASYEQREIYLYSTNCPGVYLTVIDLGKRQGKSAEFFAASPSYVKNMRRFA